MIDPLIQLRHLAAEGQALLHADNPETGTPSASFELGHDASGSIDSLIWRPTHPVRVDPRDLETIGELAVAPRLPDNGLLTAILYLPNARLLLNIEHADETILTISAATCTSL